MSRVDDLIAEHCPDGVEFKTLGDIATITTGSRPSNEELGQGGSHFFMNGGVQASGTVPTPNTAGETITIPSRGSVGIVGFQSEPFWCGPLCYRVRSNFGDVATRFLYFYLTSVQSALIALQQTGSIPALNKKELVTVRVPVPPPAIQREIAEILIRMEMLKAELDAELDAELEYRSRQYVYYRNSLLAFAQKERVRWATLSDVVVSISSGKNKSRSNAGAFPVFGSTGVIGRTDGGVYSDQRLLVARVGANAGFVHVAEGVYDVSDNTLMVVLGPEYDLRFAFHQLVSLGLNDLAVGGGQPLITAGKLKGVVVPVPELGEQRRTAAILDKFGALVNDLSVGLPAEIEARRQQYEYYRHRLLTFKERAA